jgi:hypothetical protein
MSRRYQDGCLYREKRKSGPDVWVFRYRDGQSNRKQQVGTVEQLATKKAAMLACERLRANINQRNQIPAHPSGTGSSLSREGNARGQQQIIFHAQGIPGAISRIGLCQRGAATDCAT